MPVSSDTASYRASAFRQVIGPVAWGIGATLVLLVLILVGSRKLAHFDAALVGYTFSVLFATFGLTYRYAMWLQRPPTAMYWRRGWQAFFRRGWRLRNAGTWVQRVGVDVLGNRFIFARDRLRGLTHMLIMWGCLLAVAITFPLVFGWLHFRPVARRSLAVRGGRVRLPGVPLSARLGHRVPLLPRTGVVVVPGDCRA